MTSRLVVRAHGLIILATAIVCVWAGMAFADVTKDQAAENAVKAVPGKVAEVTISISTSVSEPSVSAMTSTT